jgi:hypothetical protein
MMIIILNHRLCFLLTLIYLLIFSGCKEEKSSKDSAESSESVPLFNAPADIPANPDFHKYQLEMDLNEIDLSPFDHYGDFFKDRLKFYHVFKPQFNLENSGVDYMMLYFIDQKLVKIRYHLYQDIANNLLNSLGNCKIKTSNPVAREIIQNKKVVSHRSNKIYLNPELDQFTLIWDRDNRQIRYSVNKDTIPRSDRFKTANHFIYEMQFSNYEKMVMFLEQTANRSDSIPDIPLL